MLVGRYAPSPTGALHLGNLRTAVAAWAHARASGGRFLLRVEDLDPPRVQPGSEAQQLADLRALGIDWDEPVLRQSERSAEYEEHFSRLARSGAAYRCFCSRRDVAEALSAPHAPADPLLRYPGTCAALDPAEAERRAEAGEQHCWRLRVEQAPADFVDAFAGSLERDCLRRAGDFVVRRADGLFAYQFACALDDGLSGVTHVLRGGDLLESGPRQAWVLGRLDLPAPEYLHIPLLRAADGRRLSKRDGDDDLAGLARRGLDASAVLGLLAATLGFAEPGERPVPMEIVRRFDLAAIPRGDFLLDEAFIARWADP